MGAPYSVRCSFVVVLASMLGCELETDPYPDELAQDFRSTRSEVGTRDDPDGGMWINNGLDDPDLSGVETAFGLATSEGLDPAGSLLTDPSRRDTVEYLVECALPEESSITKVVDGETLVFHGMLGLAPEWEDGACDQECQEWVSACLLARTNVSGETVTIWMRADHPAIGLGTNPAFPVYEGSFYGNLFDGSGEQTICLGSLASPVVAFLDERTCSSGVGEDCGFTVYADCPIVPRCAYQGVLFPAGISCSTAGGSPRHAITSYIPAI